MKGDLNKDGKINLVDVNYALNCIAGNENYDYLLQNLDINNNSKFELSDINYLLNNIAGNKNYKLIDLFTEYEIEIPVAFHIIREYDDIWNSKLNKYHTSNGIIELNDDECLQKAIDILNEDFSKTIDSTYFKEYKDNYSEGQKINCIKFKLNNNNNSNNYFSINYVESDNIWLQGNENAIFYGSKSFYNQNKNMLKRMHPDIILQSKIDFTYSINEVTINNIFGYNVSLNMTEDSIGKFSFENVSFYDDKDKFSNYTCHCHWYIWEDITGTGQDIQGEPYIGYHWVKKGRLYDKNWIPIEKLNHRYMKISLTSNSHSPIIYNEKYVEKIIKIGNPDGPAPN